MRLRARSRMGILWDVATIVVVGTLGLILRLADPLSSSVIPAEDPYNHMALVREHVRRGDLAALNPEGDLYPPGLHAYLATVWSFTGLDLYDLVRFGPSALGLVSVVGIMLLLRRFDGRVAALVGGLAVAVAPEEIFRTTMMSPTALNLALLPFLIFALVEVGSGRLRWLGAAAALCVFYVFAHPWVLGLVAASCGVYGVLSWSLSKGAGRAPLAPIRGVAGVVAVTTGSLAVALTTCGGLCGPGFSNVGGIPGRELLPWGAPVLFAVAALSGWGAAKGVPGADRWWERHADRSPSLAARLIAASYIAFVLATATYFARAEGFPAFVALDRMFGWPILGLAAVGLVVLPFLRGPLAYAAASLAIVTYPLVVFNPFGSSFLPHRVAAFLGIGLALLAGLAASQLVRGTRSVASAVRRARPARRGEVIRGLGAAGVVLVLLTGGVYAGTPDGYDGGWYRLYRECELDALRSVAGVLDRAPQAYLLTAAWQPKLVVASLVQDASRVWFKPDFFWFEEKRLDWLAALRREGTPMYVVVDRYWDAGAASYLREPPWEPAGTWCDAMGVPGPRVSLFLWNPRLA